MKNYNYTEETIENDLLLKIEKLGYKYYDKNEMLDMRDYKISNVYIYDDIKESIKRINKNISDKHLNKIFAKLKNIDSSNIYDANKLAMDYLKNGIKIKDQKNKITKTYKVIDYYNLENNIFKVTNQFIVKSYGSDFKKQIPDIVIFINGLPLFVFELKSSRLDYHKSLRDAYEQIKNYQNNLKDLFIFNVFNVLFNGNAFKIGSLTSNYSWFSHWRHIGVNGEINYDYEAVKSLFDKKRILNLIKNYIHFLSSKDNVKIVPGYHQYFGVKKSTSSVVKTFDNKENKKAGIFWHVQGSGKSYSMVFLTKNVLTFKPKTTTIVITDRNDLDSQLFLTFSNSSKYLNQKVTQINSREDLIDKLNNKKQNGVFFCTIQKFSEDINVLSERENILIITDEAHRSQKNIEIKQILKDDKIIDKKGYGFYLRKSFPNATFIGFTATPIEAADHETKEIFGGYISKYLMNDATKDGFIVPLNYESRKHVMQLKEEHINLLDSEYNEIKNKIYAKSNMPTTIIKNLNKQIQKIENIICDPDRVKAVAKDFVGHYNYRKNVLQGKAMFVAYNRKMAFNYYKEIIKIAPNLEKNIRLIATQNNKVDSEELKKLLKNSKYRKEAAIEFKKPESDFKIAILVDMWLTGFNVPSLDVIYIDKPLKMHNLMQTIARVNRVYEDSKNEGLKKYSGLIVDYIGIFKRIMDAFKFYTNGESIKNKNHDWKSSEEILLDLKQYMQKITNIWLNDFEFEINRIVSEDNKALIYEKVKIIQKIIYSNKEQIELFINLTKPLTKLLNSCLSIISEDEKIKTQIILHARSELIKKELGIIEIENDVEKIKKLMAETIKYNKTIIQKTQNNKSILLSDIIQILNNKNIFGTTDEKYDIKQKVNAAKELVKRVYQINKIRSEKLSNKLNLLLQKYEENIITIEIFFSGLENFTKESMEAFENDEKLGLSWIEVAFFEILNSKEYTKEKYDFEKVKEITKKLYEKVKSNIDINWERNESQKRKVRREMKELLIELNYPQAAAIETVDEIVKQISGEVHQHFIEEGEKNE